MPHSHSTGVKARSILTKGNTVRESHTYFKITRLGTRLLSILIQGNTIPPLTEGFMAR